jgi:pimeloyl-ACP methyl ester carboxylesterase
MAFPLAINFNHNAGSDLHASLWPNSGRPVSILLHGFGHNSRIWDPLANALQSQFEVVALDFRGHGDSAWDSQKRYTHSALLEDLDALVQHLGLHNFHLVGHSLGARVAMLYSAEHTPQVTSLSIIDTGPEASNKGVNRIREDAQSQPGVFESQQQYFDWLCTRHPLALKHRLERLAEHGLRASGSQWRAKTDPAFVTALWQQDITGDGENDLRRDLAQQMWQTLAHIRCKTLVLRGQISSVLKHDVAREMVDNKLLQGELASAPMSGHAVMLDNPEFCIDTISAFLARACEADTQKAS